MKISDVTKGKVFLTAVALLTVYLEPNSLDGWYRKTVFFIAIIAINFGEYIYAWLKSKFSDQNER